MDARTLYTEKELRAEARRAIRAHQSDANADGVRARTLGYSLLVGDRVQLIAHGERNDGTRFDVRVAI